MILCVFVATILVTLGCSQNPTKAIIEKGHITAMLSREITGENIEDFIDSYSDFEVELLSYNAETNRIYVSFDRDTRRLIGLSMRDCFQVMFWLDDRVIYVRQEGGRWDIVWSENEFYINLHDEVDIFQFLDSYSEYGVYTLFHFWPSITLYWDYDLIDEPDFFAILYYDERVRFVELVYGVTDGLSQFQKK